MDLMMMLTLKKTLSYSQSTTSQHRAVLVMMMCCDSAPQCGNVQRCHARRGPGRGGAVCCLRMWEGGNNSKENECDFKKWEPHFLRVRGVTTRKNECVIFKSEKHIC